MVPWSIVHRKSWKNLKTLTFICVSRIWLAFLYVFKVLQLFQQHITIYPESIHMLDRTTENTYTRKGMTTHWTQLKTTRNSVWFSCAHVNLLLMRFVSIYVSSLLVKRKRISLASSWLAMVSLPAGGTGLLFWHMYRTPFLIYVPGCAFEIYFY